MPRFSVIVPARGVQGYLRACLDSVLEQDRPDGDLLELIAVDDCSTDATGAIIDEYARRDPRPVALHLRRPSGAGPSRNAGAALARGDYLLFLDGDDTLAPGALAAVDARLRVCGDPDVLLWDHERTDVWERRRPGGDGALLRAAGDAVFDAASRPAVLGVTPAAWNRAVRRDHWTGRGLAFADGPYEDIPYAYESLLTARRVAVLDRVCVTWRERRRGSAATTPGPHHLVAVERYEDLFARLDGLLPETDEGAEGAEGAAGEEAAADGGRLPPRAVLHARMTERLLAMLDDPDRILPADRATFFRAASRCIRRHRPAGAPLPAALRSYRAYRSLHGARDLRRELARELRDRGGAAARTAGRRYYGLRRHASLDPDLVLYGAGSNRAVSGNPYAIYRKAQEIAPQLHGVWAVHEDARDAVPAGADHVTVGSRRYWELLARATYLVTDGDFPGAARRPGQLCLQTHRGTPLAATGLDTHRLPAAGTAPGPGRVLEHADRWDFCLSANQHSGEIRERAHPGAYETLATGFPRNDRFATATAADVRAVRAALGVRPGATAVLYAPARGLPGGAAPPLDVARLAAALGPRFQLLVRVHPHDRAQGAAPELRRACLQDDGAVLDVSGHPHVEDLCLAADALLSDFSPLLFDYAVLDRPIVVHTAGWDAFRLTRGAYVDLLSGEPGDTPGVLAQDEAAVAGAFHSGRWDGPAAASLRAAFRERFCRYDDGLAAERVVRRVLLGEDEPLPHLPPGERRTAPSPRVAERALAQEDGATRTLTGPGAVVG
ncbi:glycosyltransferase [Streptomyces albofaciens JCM 4342]|uniref:bifunctional glycosyltransferase/CDP-glycerol:glycerophosphate glycerophosphotransferase n=1 Tax=Streptomyces albofaciens TaxID=66866 RepID=UPI0012392248|nr:CDP-glycerol glycerophosphotransferase family protein [Streptomyces albofaciens]KAA6221570.1 glycosyltransferase [Streptomyces albofaciens JCM 4342]